MISFISGKNFLLAFGILASVFSASAQSINWQNTIGGTGDDKLWRVSPVGDGGVFCVGFSKSGISGDKTEAAIGVGFEKYCFAAIVCCIGIIKHRIYFCPCIGKYGW